VGIVQIEMSLETMSMAMKRARLTAMVMTPRRKRTRRPARSRLRGILRFLMMGNGRTKTVVMSDGGRCCRVAIVRTEDLRDDVQRPVEFDQGHCRECSAPTSLCRPDHIY
jgi:hypothetical protein